MFVFQVFDGDRLYMIMRFQEQMQTQLNMHRAQSSTGGQNPPNINFDDLMTRQINAQEHKVGKNNALISLVINTDFDSSFIVTAA